MAKTILSRSKLHRVRGTEVVQKFQNLLIIDFEATCKKDVPIDEPEIIEFPCVAVSTENWKVQSIFHEYVKPRVNPILTPFCTDLTGIMQDTVDNEQHFPVVLEKFQRWLEINGYLIDFHAHSTFVTAGNWDLRVLLPNQCARDGLAVPNYFKRWIDLYKVFFTATKIYPKSLRLMLRQLNIQHEGRFHCGLDDSLNMARIIERLGVTTPVQFAVTSDNVQTINRK